MPGNIATYEDDTDAARSLRLELINDRAIIGTVFVDETGKGADIDSGKERLGNGKFDDKEKTLSGIRVELRDESGNIAKMYDTKTEGFIDAVTETVDGGNFEIRGYIPGKYNVVYIWGNKEYRVQYYKGTIYKEDRKQKDLYWYRGSKYKNDTISVEDRYTDALDNKEIRKSIDEEMSKLKYNTLENEINKAYNGGSEFIKHTTMESITPTMEFSVEYETTVTNGLKDEVLFTVKNVYFGILERAKQKLELEKRVSAFKITLANGQVLVDATIDEKGNLKGTHKNTSYLKPTVINGIEIDGQVKVEMDNELIEGATIETTYEIKVKNIGELDYTSENYYYYGNKTGAELVKVSVTELIDYLDGRLAIVPSEDWKETDIEYLNKVNASQKDDEEYINSTRTYLTEKLSKELAPGDTNSVEIHTSKLLTSTDDNTFNNKCEITEVTKNGGFSIGTPVQVSWNEDKSKFSFNEENSEAIEILPSTGEDRNYVLPTVIGIASLAIIGLGALGIKKFVIKKY